MNAVSESSKVAMARHSLVLSSSRDTVVTMFLCMHFWPCQVILLSFFIRNAIMMYLVSSWVIWSLDGDDLPLDELKAICWPDRLPVSHKGAYCKRQSRYDQWSRYITIRVSYARGNDTPQEMPIANRACVISLRLGICPAQTSVCCCRMFWKLEPWELTRFGLSFNYTVIGGCDCVSFYVFVSAYIPSHNMSLVLRFTEVYLDCHADIFISQLFRCRCQT